MTKSNPINEDSGESTIRVLIPTRLCHTLAMSLYRVLCRTEADPMELQVFAESVDESDEEYIEVALLRGLRFTEVDGPVITAKPKYAVPKRK